MGLYWHNPPIWLQMASHSRWLTTWASGAPYAGIITHSICPLRHNSEAKQHSGSLLRYMEKRLWKKTPFQGQLHFSHSKASLIADDRSPSQSSLMRIYSKNAGGVSGNPEAIQLKSGTQRTVDLNTWGLAFSCP